jgi:hypothetical protein
LGGRKEEGGEGEGEGRRRMSLGEEKERGYEN